MDAEPRSLFTGVLHLGGRCNPFQSVLCAKRILIGLLFLVAWLGFGCATMGPGGPPAAIRGRGEWMEVEATGYCACGRCCNWRRNWWGQPVIASGPRQGQFKAVGVTASGTRARPGTVAADPAVLPFGTIVYVPGYGWGRVEDTGREIRGHRIDLFFEQHDGAIAWGRRRLRIQVWKPVAASAISSRR